MSTQSKNVFIIDLCKVIKNKRWYRDDEQDEHLTFETCWIKQISAIISSVEFKMLCYGTDIMCSEWETSATSKINII